MNDIPGDSDDETIVIAIIKLAHALKIDCIAEGVETDAQADFLRHMGCDQVQGYLFSKPLTVAQMDALLENTHFHIST